MTISGDWKKGLDWPKINVICKDAVYVHTYKENNNTCVGRHEGVGEVDQEEERVLLKLYITFITLTIV